MHHPSVPAFACAHEDAKFQLVHVGAAPAASVRDFCYADCQQNLTLSTTLPQCVQRVLTPKDWEAYCKAEDSPLAVLHEDSEATSASDVMTKVRGLG